MTWVQIYWFILVIANIGIGLLHKKVMKPYNKKLLSEQSDSVLNTIKGAFEKQVCADVWRAFVLLL